MQNLPVFVQNLPAYCWKTLVSFFLFYFTKLTSVNSAHAGKFCVYYIKLTSLCTAYADKFWKRKIEQR